MFVIFWSVFLLLLFSWNWIFIHIFIYSFSCLFPLSTYIISYFSQLSVLKTNMWHYTPASWSHLSTQVLIIQSIGFQSSQKVYTFFFMSAFQNILFLIKQNILIEMFILTSIVHLTLRIPGTNYESDLLEQDELSLVEEQAVQLWTPQI